MMIVDLIYNLALLVALSPVSGFIENRWNRFSILGRVFQGLLFGGAAMIGMLRPLVYSQGLIFDGRSVLISLCGLFFGPWSAGITCLMTIPLRVWQGGSGMIMGVSVILCSAAIGTFFFYRRKISTWEISAARLMGFGLLVHLAMLAMTVNLPAGMTLPVLKRIALPVLLTYPLATVLIGKILSDQETRSRFVAALQKSEAKYRQLYDSMTDAVVSVEMTGRLVEFNQAFQNLVGYSPEELHRLTYRDLTPEKWHAAEQKIVEEQILLRGHSEVYEKEYRHKKGTVFPVELRTFLLRDDAGRPVGMWAIVRDITERKRLEEQLRQSQKMEAVGTLAGGIAHDFNNLLTVVLGQADLAMMEPGLPHSTSESLKQIIESANRAANLTRQLLTFSRKQPILPQHLDLNAVVSNLTKMLARIIGEDIHLESRLSPEKLWIQADLSMLEQVLLNLAVNARDAMPQGGTLVIDTRAVFLDQAYIQDHPGSRSGQFVRVCVKDTGSGIAPNILSHIFDPFFTTKEVGRGTGLGLATALAIVDQHQGWIEVQSQPGAGSSFCVFFPAAAEKRDETKAASPSTSPPRGHETILLVEDEASLRTVVKTTLQGFGYHVLEADSGIAALKVWEEHEAGIDLLLTDIIMPQGMSGLALADQLQTQRPALKILFTTGYSPDLDQANLLQGKPVRLLQKPFTPGILTRAVRDALDDQPLPSP